jgi:hypothetical protein
MQDDNAKLKKTNWAIIKRENRRIKSVLVADFTEVNGVNFCKSK